MSPERSWKMRVEDTLACIDKICAYTRGMDFEQYHRRGRRAYSA